MPEDASLNYRYLKYSTIILFAAGTVGACLLLRGIPVRRDVFWPALAGMVLPGGILAGLFVYKCRVGIKRARLGLSRWALFVSLALLPFHALAWFGSHPSYFLWIAVLVGVQLANVALAAGRLRRRSRFLAMPFGYLIASFALQFVVMRLMTR